MIDPIVFATTMQMKINIQSLAIISFVTMNQSALAFDDDKTISDIHLKDESFLDINAHQFRKSLDMIWSNTLNGWRTAGGSVSTDRLFLQNELRLQRHLSRVLSFGMELEQENFYTKKPMPLPLFFADIYPHPTQDIGISVIGSPAYDKRQGDFGYAITFGRRPTQYSRFSWLMVDKFYNDKNEFDDSYYEKYSRTLRLEGVSRLKQGWDIYYDLKKESPMDFIFDNQTSRFQHESYDYKVNLIYHLSTKRFAGVNVRTLNVDKHLQESTSDEGQKIDSHMLDIYWVDTVSMNSGSLGNGELTAGFRYDAFTERLRDYITQSNSYDFELTTWQAYSLLHQSYTLHQAWELGLYLAWSERSRQYLVSSSNEFDDSGIQAKLKTSWQYHSIDKSSVLLISMTFNLDDLIDDPGDGGGVYFQSLF